MKENKVFLGGRGIPISGRLLALADLVSPGSRVVDVGCDHAFLSIYLVQRGRALSALAMDVREGPLSAAGEHIREAELTAKIETRLSDGLALCRPGEADTLVCAGMGGRLMRRILTQGREVVCSLREMILQPQSEIPDFRRFLLEAGHRIAEERLVFDEGKYYFLMRVLPAGSFPEMQVSGAAAPDDGIRSVLTEHYGSSLFTQGGEVWRNYLTERLRVVAQIRVSVEEGGERGDRPGANRERLWELAEEERILTEALQIVERDRREYMVRVTIDGVTKEYPDHTTYEAIAAEYQERYDGMIALVAVDGKIRELFKKVKKDCTVAFFTLKDDVGHKTYVRTATMLLMKSICEVFGNEAAQNCRVEFAVGHGYYVRPGREEGQRIEPTGENAERIRQAMRGLVERCVPFHKRAYPLDDAMELFAKQGMKDKERLFRYRMGSYVNLYEMEGYYDYYYGYMLPNAGYVKWFDLIPYEEGFMLLLPGAKNPTRVDPFSESKKLFQTLQESEEWSCRIGIGTVGDLNDQICAGALADMILVQEAEQERKIAEIAKDIVSREGVKFVMIAGPSSSGKTSLSHRLSIQLRTLGKVPHPIALDNYFVDREFTPRDENGDYNFECLEAIDVEGFNSDMLRLLAGEEVEMPTFNFKIGKREYHGETKKLGPDDILVIEGIHGLNQKMSYALPEESKYKIYISALTSINVDEHNRIPTTDGRLLRRLVRDARTRGADAKRTISMWPSVRRGEEENIFPFQEKADAMFNSALVYELAVLKPFAEPLLFQIQKGDPTYYEAKRLLKFLNYFLSVPSESLPNNSICREFVGGSCFNV